jgi:hypothetical protein
LETILKRASTVEYQENDSDVHAVGELAEDVRDTIIEYQVSPDLLITLRIHY